MSSHNLNNEGDFENLKKTKTPFNKKKWRDQKYSNKAKVQQWENINRIQLLRKHNKKFKNSTINLEEKSVKNNGIQINRLKQAQLKYQTLQQDKNKKKEERRRIQKEKEHSMLCYKERKAIKYKKLSQKTRKGQPLMKGRIELLLEKIQTNFVNKKM